MAPIRVGICGLSTNSDLTKSGAWGVNSHLAPIRAMPDKYEIVAVANSSVESSQKSIDFHGLAGAKAYGNPSDLAADPDVDLVVVSVNVAKHLDLATPALKHKKQIFVEWPLGAGLAESEKLARLAAEQGVKTIVGVQARADPAVVKAKELIASGKLGNIISSTATISTGFLPADMWVTGGEYFISWKSGGNEFFIPFAHFLDTFTHVLGDFSTVTGIMSKNSSSVQLFDPAFTLVEPAYPKDTPDHIFVQGTLESGAVASIAQRKPFCGSSVDGIGFRWLVTGTEGELEMTSPEDQWQFGPEGKTLRVKIGKEGKAEEVEYMSPGDSFEGVVKRPGTNTGRVYEAFAVGDTEKYADFESAIKTHRLLDRIVKSAGWESV